MWILLITCATKPACHSIKKLTSSLCYCCLVIIFLLRSASPLDITLYFIFSELPNFLSDEECDHIIELAEMFGLEGSIMHTDEYQEKHRKEVKGTILKILSWLENGNSKAVNFTTSLWIRTRWTPLFSSNFTQVTGWLGLRAKKFQRKRSLLFQDLFSGVAVVW